MRLPRHKIGKSPSIDPCLWLCNHSESAFSKETISNLLPIFFFSKSRCWFMTLAIKRSTYIHDCRIPQTQSLTFKYSTNESTCAWYWDPKIICNNWHMLSISMLFCFSSDKNKLHKVDISMCVRMIKRKDTVMFQDETTSQTC